MPAFIPAILGAIGRGVGGAALRTGATRAALGAGARGAVGGSLRKTVSKKLLGAAYEASGASRVPVIEKMVSAGSRGYEAYKAHRGDSGGTITSSSSENRERREAENQDRQDRAHQQSMSAISRADSEGASHTLEAMANDVAEIKEAIVGQGEGESKGGILGSIVKAIVSASMVVRGLQAKLFRTILGPMVKVVSATVNTFKSILGALGKTTLGKMLGLGSLAFAFDAAANDSESDYTDTSPSDSPAGPVEAADAAKGDATTVAKPPAKKPSLFARTAAAAWNMSPLGASTNLTVGALAKKDEPPIQAQSSSGPLGGASPAAKDEEFWKLVRRAETGKRADSDQFNTVTSWNKVPLAKPISEMTIAEVREWQTATLRDQYRSGRRPQGKGSSAAGAYQFMTREMNDLPRKLGLSDDTIFSPEVQTAMADRLLRDKIRERGGGDHVRPLEAYRAGKIPHNIFQNSASGAWMALKNSQGIGIHDEAGFNKATINAADVSRAALAAAPSTQGPALAAADAKARDAERQKSAPVVVVPPAPPVQNTQARSMPSGASGAGAQTPMITRSPDGLIRAYAISNIAHSV